MRIGVVAPTHNPLPFPPGKIWAPGIIISNLVNGLAKKGHQVFLYAARDSKINPQTNLKINKQTINSIFHDSPKLREENFAKFTELFAIYDLSAIALAIEEVKAQKLDILHFHDIRRPLFLNDLVAAPALFTYHNNFDEEYKYWLEYASNTIGNKINIVALSQKHSLQFKKYFRNVFIAHNGIDTKNFEFDRKGGSSFLFAGRLIKNKGLETAITIAKNEGIYLNIAGHEGDTKEDKEYFKNVQKTFEKNINYLGFYPYEKMPTLYKNARAILTPIEWEEPFGLTMVESMACGTPVIAFDSGSVGEIIVNGKTGFIVHKGDYKKMGEVVKKVNNMSEKEYQEMRSACRLHVEKNYSITSMVEDYEIVYKKIRRNL